MLTVAFRIVRTHWFGTVVATVGSLVFFGASLYGDEIRAAFPFYWGPFGGWSVPALFFWAGLIVVTGMLALKNAGDDAARSELVEVTTKVAILVQTLPPKGWRDEYAATVDEAADALDSLLPRRLEEGLGSPELAGIIRNLLGSIVSLAYRFDHRPRIGTKPALYAGNIMLFEGRGGVVPHFAQSTLAALRFLPPEYDVSHLQGVLHLDPEPTYSTEREGPDTDVPAIALPVPDVVKAPNGKWRVLPGGPARICS